MDKKSFQNTLLFTLLVIGLVTYILDSWIGEKPEEVPASREEAVSESEDRESEDAAAVPSAEDLVRQLAAEPEEDVDVEALREEIRQEVLAELQAEQREVPPTPEPVVEEEPPEVEIPSGPPYAMEMFPEPVAEEQPVPESTPAVSEAELQAMQDYIQQQEQRISTMRRIISAEDRALEVEKTRILRWQQDVHTKHQDDLFAKTKTRAEEREIQSAIGSWRSRRVRQRTRGEMLSEAEKDLELRREQYREALRM